MAASRPMPNPGGDKQRHVRHGDPASSPRKDAQPRDVFHDGNDVHGITSKGTPLNDIVNICRDPPELPDMEELQKKKNNTVFMISPFRYNQSRSDNPQPANVRSTYIDLWNEDHVRMPCSKYFISKNKEPTWPMLTQLLKGLKSKCDHQEATIEDLKKTIDLCAGRKYDMPCLEMLLNDIYLDKERAYFMSTVLSNICSLALSVDIICGQPPPVLRMGSNQSVTMSQQQAACLLACAFFCLFPYRSHHEQSDKYKNFQDPNFSRLYQNGLPEKIQKLKCILHYFRRVTEKMPNGVITFRRFSLSSDKRPNWSTSRGLLSDMHLTTGEKIEDVKNVLQVDFANKYIGGGVLGSGCVQEEIRFTICPEMLVSLLVCEMMEPNECIFLTGCERYSSYKGYAQSFEFSGDYRDNSPKDNWGQKWCHLVAMDAVCFRDRTAQYKLEFVDRELLKAYTSFYLQKTGQRSEVLPGIVTGSWGCGAFNGDKELKAIIQLMAASEANRPLVYAAYCDTELVNSFAEVYEYLKKQKATVGHLYRYLERYSTRYDRGSLFNYILKTPVSSL